MALKITYNKLFNDNPFRSYLKIKILKQLLSRGNDAAVQHDRMTRDPCRRHGTQVNRRAGRIRDPAYPAPGDSRIHLLLTGLTRAGSS